MHTKNSILIEFFLRIKTQLLSFCNQIFVNPHEVNQKTPRNNILIFALIDFETNTNYK